MKVEHVGGCNPGCDGDDHLLISQTPAGGHDSGAAVVSSPVEREVPASGVAAPVPPAGFTMTSTQWLGALSQAWWLGHRDVCIDCCCPERVNPYRVTAMTTNPNQPATRWTAERDEHRGENADG